MQFYCIKTVRWNGLYRWDRVSFLCSKKIPHFVAVVGVSIFYSSKNSFVWFCLVVPLFLVIFQLAPLNIHSLLIHQTSGTMCMCLPYRWCNAPFFMFTDIEQCQLIIESLTTNDMHQLIFCANMFSCKTMKEINMYPTTQNARES